MHIPLLIAFMVCATVVVSMYFKYSCIPRKTWRDLDESCAFIQREGQTGILCLDCGKVSFHPDDVAKQYCGFCHKFHDDPFPEEVQFDDV